MVRRFGLLAIVFIILLAGIISASFEIGDLSHSIDEKYGPGATLSGWINISLTEEPSNSLFESSEGDTATLMTLINGNKDFSYSCTPLSCISNYETGDSGTTKTITLNALESAIIGFKISGSTVSDVSGFSIDVQSNAPESSTSQLFIDILNNEEREWQSYKASGNFGNAVYGCYTSAEEQAEIIQVQYCQKITVPASPNVEIGAELIGTGDVDFEMNIESIDFSEYGDCIASASGSGSISCVPDDFKVNEEKDYFVCIKTKNSADNKKYEINYETNNPCGFSGNFNDEYEFDFEIFVKPGKYDAVSSFTLNNAELSNAGSDVNNMESYIEDYLDLTYGNDCSDNCIIPLKIISMVNQEISISNPSLSYFSGVSTTTTDLYDLTEIPAKISADMQKLDIDSGGFTIPSEYGEHTISLEFKNSEIFSEKISVEKVPRIRFLNPINTATIFPTTFNVKVDSDKNISFYEWDFGDGGAEITTTNKVTYTYNSTGTYNMKIRVIDVDKGSSSKTFIITVGSASEMVEPLLQEKKINLELVKGQMNNFYGFERKIINQTLEIENSEIVLANAEADNAQAVTEADYQAILKDLLGINVPKMIFASAVADSIIFYPEENSVNIDILTEITGEEYDSSKEDKYINAVLGWNVENVDITVTYKEITSSFESYDEPFLKFFEVDITKKAGTEGDPYIILKEVDGLTFDGDYLENEKLGYLYVPLVEESKKIIFSTTEDVDFISLPLFVSPEISKLSLVDFDWTPFDEEGKLKRWALFTLIILLLIIVGITLWVVLQTWYKKRYEDYLFKNKNNLYNLYNWIENAKKRGLGEKEIRLKLKKVGWTPEQLRYATRKHAGKRTGMLEIPIKKVVKKSASQKRLPGNQQQNARNLRFKPKSNFNTKNKK